AEERVFAGFEPFHRGRRAAFGDDFGSAEFFAAFGFDFDVMSDRGGVFEVDRQVAGFRRHFFLRVGEAAARVGFDFNRGAGAAGFAAFFFGFAAGFFASRFRFSGRRPARRFGFGFCRGAVVATAGGEREGS